MMLYQKSFFRSALYRTLLFLLTLLLGVAALAGVIGTGYNIFVGSYGTTETVPFIDSPLADRMAYTAVQNMSHELFNSLNNGTFGGTVHGTVSIPLITLTPSPMPTSESTPVPTPTPMPTDMGEPMSTQVPAQTLYGTAPSVDAPIHTDPPIEATFAPVASTPTPRVIDPYPMDVTPMPNVMPADDSDGRLVLDDEKREYIRETMAAYLTEVDNPAFVFTLYDAYGNVIAVSDAEEEQLRKKDIWCMTAYIEQDPYSYYGWSSTYGAPMQEQLAWLQESAQDAHSMPLMLTASLRTLLPANNIVARAEWLHYRMTGAEAWLPWTTLTLLALAFLALCLLLSAAGRRVEDTAFHRSFIDRLPTELYLGGMGFLVGVSLWLIFSASDNGGYTFGALMVLCGTILLGIGTLVLCMGIAVRCKTKTLWKNSLCAIVWRILSRFLRWLNDTAEAIIKNIRFLWKLLFIACAYLLLTILTLSSRGGNWGVLWLFVSAIGIVLTASIALQLDRLRDGAKRMRAGDLTKKIPLKGLYGSFRAHAEDLNGMADGLGRAVEERIKSERMKTDLITNVSHDLKTPLTSIVNYVDLLKAEDLANETAKGYIEVLDRQAQRLKKLTVDIVDASKAQSGALNVTLAPTDLAELLRQCTAEYEERFAAIPLIPMLHTPETLTATADGRLLFRVLDNLLGNAVKYAMPNTRLYLDAYESGEHACISLKNISREALNIPVDELTARFVRGDASRATEGSGLGLSIAEDLMRLMGGTLRLSIDGDLFRAVIELPKA